jgi:hypothetical protein
LQRGPGNAESCDGELGVFEFYRRQAGQLKAKREAASRPVKPAWAVGSEEWREEQEALHRGDSGG